jgi:hypothetical protein
MGRPKGSRNRRTLLKEAEQNVGSKYVDQVIDSGAWASKNGSPEFDAASQSQYIGSWKFTVESQ